MRCLKCKAPISSDNIEAVLDDYSDEIEVKVNCTECDEEYYTFLKLKDLTPNQ